MTARRWAIRAVILIGALRPVLLSGQSLADYPPVAGSKGEHGTVRLQLDVAENGQIIGCKVPRPSGALDLDGQACEAAKHGLVSPSNSVEVRSLPLTIHYIVPGQQITNADLPIGKNEMVVLFNPARDEAQRRYGVTGPGKGRLAMRLNMKASPTYPLAARAAGHEGTVYAAIGVSKKGKPDSCSVVRSSGYVDLDEATCSYVMTNAHYEPGTDYYGKPIDDFDLVHISWKAQ